MPPELLAAPFFAAAGLLAWAGLMKMRRPGPATRALAAAGLPHGRWPVRILGAGELGLGGCCLVQPSMSGSLALVALYVAFADFLARAVHAGADASCGCAGERDVPPSWIHVALNLSAAAVAALVAARPDALPGFVPFAWTLPFHGVGFAAGVALLAYLGAVSAAYLPQALVAYREAAR